MNAKLTDFGAAIGLVQLKKLPQFIRRRQSIADFYRRTLAGASVDFPPETEPRGHVYHRFILRVKRGGVDRLIAALGEEKIHCRRPVFKPLHRILGEGGFATSDRVWERALSLPCYPSLTDEEAARVSSAVGRLL